MSKKEPVSVSMDPELAEWARDNARPLGFRNRSDLIVELICSLRTDRLIWLPPPNPFPSEKKYPSPGEEKSSPLLVAK